MCGIGDNDDFFDPGETLDPDTNEYRSNWEIAVFNNSDDCGYLCGYNDVAGCHIIAVSMMEAYYRKGHGKEERILPNGHNFNLPEYHTWLINNGAADGCKVDWFDADLSMWRSGKYDFLSHASYTPDQIRKRK